MKLLIVLILSLPAMSAWDWPTHESTVEAVYYSLPPELRLKLNITSMKEGSIAPDKDFHDNVLHSYPKSYNKSVYWINKTKHYLSIEDYNKASYSFGILTHYISDSFAAPHNVKKEPSYLHSKYEKQAFHRINTKCDYYNLTLNSLSSVVEYSEYWSLWLKDQNSDIPRKNLEEAMPMLYSLALDIFNTTCFSGSTTIEKSYYFLSHKTLLVALILILIFFIYCSIFKD